MIISDLDPTQGAAVDRWGAPPLGTPSRLEPPWHPSKPAGALRGRPKRRQELPKRGPERPREPQESPKRAPWGTKRRQERFWSDFGAFWDPLGPPNPFQNP